MTNPNVTGAAPEGTTTGEGAHKLGVYGTPGPGSATPSPASAPSGASDPGTASTSPAHQAKTNADAARPSSASKGSSASDRASGLFSGPKKNLWIGLAVAAVVLLFILFLL